MIGFTCSSFDLLHAGHVEMLKECKENCDKLIVGLNTNPIKHGKYPVQNVVERYSQLSAIKYVDEIIPYATEADLRDLLNLYHIDIRFIGEDYKGREFTGDDLPIEIFFNSRQHGFSTSILKDRVINQKEILDGNTIKDTDTYRLIDNTTLNELTVSTTTLHPDKSTRGHSHDNQEEVYHFLSGVGLMLIDDNEYYAEAGKTFTISAGQFHKVTNTSHHDDLAFFCVFSGGRNH